MPVPVRSLDTGASCGGATDSVFTGMPLLVRRNHLAHERPSPGAAHGRARFHSDTTIRAGDSAGLSRAAAPFSQRYHTCAAIQHFASVITLAKCGFPLKTPLRLQNSSTAAPTGSLCNTKLHQKGIKGNIPPNTQWPHPSRPTFKLHPTARSARAPAAIPAAPLERPRSGLRPRSSSEQRLLLNQERPAAPTSGWDRGASRGGSAGI